MSKKIICLSIAGIAILSVFIYYVKIDDESSNTLIISTPKMKSNENFTQLIQVDNQQHRNIIDTGQQSANPPRIFPQPPGKELVIGAVNTFRNSPLNSKEHVLAMILLSEINTDKENEVFFQQINTTDSRLFPHFVSSVVETKTVSSFLRLMDLMSNNASTSAELRDGSIMLYKDTVDQQVFGFALEGLKSANSINNNQSAFIFSILSQGPSSGVINIATSELNKLTPVDRQKLSAIISDYKMSARK